MQLRLSTICWLSLLSFVSTTACKEDAAAKLVVPTKRIDSRFVFEEHAFSFENFAGPVHGSHLTINGIERMFGKGDVCNVQQQGDCKLLPIAREYIKTVNETIESGRCEGFAILSGLAAVGDVDVTAFGANTARELSIESNAPLGEEIAYWYATQYLQDVVPETTHTLSASEALSFLTTEYQKKDHTLYRIGMARIDPDTGAYSGGHAVLAIAVQPRKNNDDFKYSIIIYDNNHPQNETEILVDVKHNTWEYNAAQNPDDPSALYKGTEKNNNSLYVAPAPPRRGQHTCTFCDSDDDEPMAQVFGSAAAQVMVEHGEGSSVGEHDGGHTVDHEEGHHFPHFTAACHNCRDGMHAGVPHHPELGTTLYISQAVHADTNEGFADAIHARFFAPHTAVVIEGADVDTDETHSLHIDGDGQRILFSAPEVEVGDSVDLTLAKNLPTHQVLYEASCPSCRELEVRVDDEGDLAMRIDSLATVADNTVLVPLTIAATDDATPDAPERAFTLTVPVPNDGEAQVELATLSAEGAVVLLDHDGDGVFEDQTTVTTVAYDPETEL